MILVGKGGVDFDLSNEELEDLFGGGLRKMLYNTGVKDPVLILPPDITRFHSRAGFLTDTATDILGKQLGAVLPATGTHSPMTKEEIKRMFPNTPAAKFLTHDWRNDFLTMGHVPFTWVRNATEGKAQFDWPVQVNRNLRDSGFGLIVSIGQVVPHEVAGMANHAKNLFVGTGGKEAIDKSHFVGAAYGMERIMGRADTPVRGLFDQGIERFGSKLPPILFALTVVSPRTKDDKPGDSPTAVRGLYMGTDRECYEKAAALAAKVNITFLETPLRKAVVYLDPEEYRTTWLGNKAIYRTRMAMEDGGELLIIAPGLTRFGEDKEIDALIRRIGYRPSLEILDKVKKDRELRENLSAAAHLIHGSSEGRFTVRYCPGPGVTKDEIESVGFSWGSLEDVQNRYQTAAATPGWNTASDGEPFFYVPNPGLGLWTERGRFTSSV